MLLACIAYAVLLALSAPPWPDDWDGLGFLASAGHFDMDRFAPHPPGYPVYVGALKAANVVLRDPRTSAYAVAILSGLAAVLLLFDAARRLWGPAAARWVAVTVAILPLAWRSMTAVGTEALALAFAALAAWALVRARDRERSAYAALGIAVGLGLGVRMSWAPLYLSMALLAPGGVRRRSATFAFLAVSTWAVPLLLVVGPKHLVHLYEVHAAGHASQWGGTALTHPGPTRLIFLMRDVFVDGLGADADPLGLAIAVVAAAVAALGIAARRRAGWRGLPQVGFLLVPYLLWIGFGQNLRQQPRHTLPLVVGLAVGLALSAFTHRRGHALGLVLLLLVGARTFVDARARRTIPPPGAQLLLYVQSLPAPTDVAVFAGPAARFFEPTELRDRARTAGSLGDAMLALTRMDRLPKRVLVTSELEGLDAPQYPIGLLATFCRPPRIDRRAPCLSVYEWQVPYTSK